VPFPRWYRVNPTPRQTTPGAATDLGYVVLRNPTSQDQAFGVTNLSLPTPLLATTLVEGVDLPFWSRFQVGSPERNQKVKLFGWVQVVQSSTWGLGLPFPIFEYPADTTPILVGKSFEQGDRNWRAKELAKRVRAITSVTDAPGAWIESVPSNAYSVTVCEIFNQIQEALLEVPDEGQAFGSGLWTIPEVLGYMNLRISRFLMETGVVQTRSTQAATAGDAIYNLPGDLIDLRRVAWTSGATTKVLPRSDAFEADMGMGQWDLTPGVPQVSMQVPEGSLEIRVAPLASADFTLDLVYVADLPPVTNDCAPFPIPDEWTVYIKWGVLADMLSKEGEANDPQRAAYCNKRWSEGVSLARLYMGTNQ
jgi:hypothetical protein